MSSFSRKTFDKLKHYVGVRLQQGVPLVDADWNEQEDIHRDELRSFLKNFMGNGIPEGSDGFLIKPAPGDGAGTIVLTSNKADTGVSMLDVDLENSTAAETLGFTANRCSVERWGSTPVHLTGGNTGPFELTDGMKLAVKTDGFVDAEETVFQAADFADIGAATAAEVVTAINAAVTHFTAAQGGGNDFVIGGGGRCLVEGWEARVENSIDYTAQVLYNNDALATQWGVPTLAPLSPPTSGERTDTVYLDVWERTVDETEDENLVNPAIGIETCIRLKREWVVRVAAGPLPEDGLTQYLTDSNLLREGHEYYVLAVIARPAGVQTIGQEHITDQRDTGVAVLSSHLEKRFVRLRDGKVGIGNTDPQIQLAIGDNDTGLQQQGENRLAVYTNNNERLRVDPDGNVGIGTVLPGHKLDVHGSVSVGAQGNSFNHRLLAGDIKRNALFGYSVSISGNHAIVGAYGEDNNTGAVYFFEKDAGGNWTQTQKLQAGDKVAGQNFGQCVAIDGDRAIAGAYHDNDGGTKAGAAYIFEKDGNGTWVQTQKLKASDKEEYDNFGICVAIKGELALIGAHGADDMAHYGGVIICFLRGADGTWTEQTTRLKSADIRAYDYFGRKISISGNRVIAGVYDTDLDSNHSISSVGAAYIFEKNGTNWEQKLRVQPGGFGQYYRFGVSVCIDGDQAIVGAPGHPTSSTEEAAAYIYTCDSDGNWSETATRKLQPDDPTSFIYFGCSVAISGNLAAVGASWDNAGGTQNGAVYIYEKNSDGTWPSTHTQKLWCENIDGGPHLGATVAIGGDQLFVGSYPDGSGEYYAGAVYIYEKDADGTWRPKNQEDDNHNDLHLKGELNFSPGSRQLIRVPGTSFGMGIQENTQYFRTNENFAFYKEGFMQMIIKDGKVGIATDDPGEDHLDVRGTCYSSGGWNTTNADYAEYFESQSGKTIPPGTAVFIDTKGKIRPAKEGETPIGVISVSPSVMGNSPKEWPGKYMRDDFGQIVMETHEQEGVTKTRPKLNPDYDETRKYIPRNSVDRPEWNCVGLLGQLPLLKGQPTAPTWVKIKNISKKAELWLVK